MLIFITRRLISFLACPFSFLLRPCLNVQILLTMLLRPNAPVNWLDFGWLDSSFLHQRPRVRIPLPPRRLFLLQSTNPMNDVAPWEPKPACFPELLNLWRRIRVTRNMVQELRKDMLNLSSRWKDLNRMLNQKERGIPEIWWVISQIVRFNIN